jgi:hypothetical protein
MRNDTEVKLMAGLAPCTKLSSIFSPTIGQNNELGLCFGQKEGLSALSPQLEQLLSPILLHLYKPSQVLYSVVGRFEARPRMPITWRCCTTVRHPLTVILSTWW